MTDQIEHDFRPVNPAGVATQFITDSTIEIIDGFVPSAALRHVLFDFDGTLSLVREGWTEVMVPMMVEYLLETGTDETSEHLSGICAEFVMQLTGKQTIYQMIRLAEEIRQRGGRPLEPAAYKHEYHKRLMQRIESRRERLRSGQTPPTEMVVPGSFELLNRLRDRDVQLYLASGTDEQYVREEVDLLQLGEYFGPHVYGAQEDYRSFSKAQVIQRILTEHSVDGATLLGFGDGYVEIQNVRDVGGTAVAVASDETERSGRPDAWKRDRLIAAGAHAVVPDYQDAGRLVEWLWNI
ncbi:MAG: HAD hydrolase-like protein [Fuerstiella sp.]|nr:HAD hydrolase-like protein [Fuerstiella sp.]